MSERDVQDSLKFMREKLRKERKAQNMSQLTLSAEADLACNTICRIEKGTAEPGIGNLLRLTDALHIPMSELFPQGEGPKAKEIGIIDDAQLQEIISLWHAILVREEFSCLEFIMNRDTINWILKKLNTGGRTWSIYQRKSIKTASATRW